jgi:hypothetical protein
LRAGPAQRQAFRERLVVQLLQGRSTRRPAAWKDKGPRLDAAQGNIYMEFEPGRENE